ncbi:hypothetical protein AAIE21_28780, partial [Paenibacillus sp. 102]
IETRQGLFDMPTFIKSIKDNNKLYEKTAFCMKIYLKLMDVWCHPKKKQIHQRMTSAQNQKEFIHQLFGVAS